MHKTINIYEGKVVENPFGNWSDVDKGWYVGHNDVKEMIWNLEGKNVRITVEVLPDEEED
jgi:hypothetical protein